MLVPNGVFLHMWVCTVLQLSALEISSVSSKGWYLECTGATLLIAALMVRTGLTPFGSLKFR